MGAAVRDASTRSPVAPGTGLVEGEPFLFLVPADVSAAGEADREEAIDPRSHPRRPRRSPCATRLQSGREPARRRRAPPQDEPAHRARKPGSTLSIRAASSNTARWRSPRSAAAARSEELIKQHARPTAWSPGIGTVNGADFGEHKRALRRDGLRLHRACRHAGRDEPQKKDRLLKVAERMERCRSSASPKAAADGPATPTIRASPVSTYRRSGSIAKLSGLVPLRRHRCPAAASPATPPCSAAATSSSPTRTRTSAWAARR